MLSIFYRRFYILLFLIWISGIAGLFVFSVWGDFGTFINDFKSVVQDGSIPPVVNGTVAGSGFRAAAAIENATDSIEEDAESAEHTVRREVVHEVKAARREAAHIFEGEPEISDPISKEIEADKAEEKSGAGLVKNTQPPELGKLTGFSALETKERFMARLVTNKQTDDVTYFWMNKPLQLVVDLRGKWINITPNVFRFAEGFISHVVMGIHPDRLRLVFKLRSQNGTQKIRPELLPNSTGLDIVIVRPMVNQ
ncbi:AMIN domain-containing protein [Maridesulfovibrio zosterae]|uniref:AMIN domain-containing protein n=1 Tax=Maridesulfovibrio zosterae TaxID=82171 RepID=UPI000481564A|nr:AMIN domain-containing protein [Maridesulfovibrio zosterae]